MRKLVSVTAAIFALGCGAANRGAVGHDELRVIGGEMEGGRWMTDEDRANAGR